MTKSQEQCGFRVYDLLTDELRGELDAANFQRLVEELSRSRKDNGALDGTGFGSPDRAIYVPDTLTAGGKPHPGDLKGRSCAGAKTPAAPDPKIGSHVQVGSPSERAKEFGGPARPDGAPLATCCRQATNTYRVTRRAFDGGRAVRVRGACSKIGLSQP